MTLSRGLAFLALIFVADDALAAPPSSCANKFIGKWQHVQATSLIGRRTAEQFAAAIRSAVKAPGRAAVTA
jgi:hypothetical protein